MALSLSGFRLFSRPNSPSLPSEMAMTTLTPHKHNLISQALHGRLWIRAEQVAAALLGEPSQVSQYEQRLGRHGSGFTAAFRYKARFWV